MQTNDWVISRERVCTPMRLSEPVQEQSIELDYTLPDYFPDFFRLLHCFAEPRITAQKTADDAVQYTLTKLKRKILLHGRTFIDHGEEKVSLYFYDNEAQKLIMLTSLYLSAFGNPTNDYYSQIGLTRKGVGSSHDAEQDHSQT